MTLDDYIFYFELEASCKCNPNRERDYHLVELLQELKQRREKDNES